MGSGLVSREPEYRSSFFTATGGALLSENPRDVYELAGKRPVGSNGPFSMVDFYYRGHHPELLRDPLHDGLTRSGITGEPETKVRRNIFQPIGTFEVLPCPSDTSDTPAEALSQYVV